VRTARVSLGGVASRPWRAPAAETALQGRVLSEETALAAGAAAFAGAAPRGENAFKIELGRRAVAKAALVAARRA
jgi:xanthine dehydrogenase YagS FAD-binding subunit